MPLRRGLPALAGLLLTACSLLPPPDQPAVPGRRIAAPTGYYASVAWLPSNWLVVRYEPVPREKTYRLFRLRPDGSAFAHLPLGENPACRLTRYVQPHALPDWRLGFQKLCLDDPRVQPVHGNYDSSYLMAYDLRTGAEENLLAVPIVGVSAGHGVSWVTWNPALTRGMFGESSGLCSSIAWMTPTAISAPRITIQDGWWPRRRWQVERNLESDRRDYCLSDGQVGWPAWSPGGQLIAFFASPQAIGVDGFARASVPWNLYLMDPEEQQPRKVLGDIQYPRALAWSPDSRWLALAAGAPTRRPGLWLYAVESGELRRVSEHYILEVAWSPDGQQLVAIRRAPWRGEDPGPPQESELLLFDVSALVATP